MSSLIDKYQHTDIHLPLPPCVDGNLDSQKFEMAVYARFMRHLRYSERACEAVKVLEAIRFVADLMDHSEAHIAKVLTDLGLRAPRAAYPAAFLDFADNAMACGAWQLGAADADLKALHDFWAHYAEKKPLQTSTNTESSGVPEMGEPTARHVVTAQ